MSSGSGLNNEDLLANIRRGLGAERFQGWFGGWRMLGRAQVFWVPITLAPILLSQCVWDVFTPGNKMAWLEPHLTFSDILLVGSGKCLMTYSLENKHKPKKPQFSAFDDFHVINFPPPISNSNMMSLNAVVGRDAHNHKPIHAGSNMPPANQPKSGRIVTTSERKSFPRSP